VTTYSCAPKDFANSRAYSEALDECSEPSIATNIFEILVFTKLDGVYLDKGTPLVNIANNIKV
jgi:hypothetical protein